MKHIHVYQACSITYDWLGHLATSLHTKIIGASLSEPHINVKFVRSVCLSVCLSICLSICLSVRTFMTRKYTRTVLIYGYLQLLIAAFKAGLVHWFVYTNIQQTCSDKQLEQTRSYTKKQVYRSLMNNTFI